jgi:putative endonuclease
MPSAKRADCFWIYMLECDNGSYYTGYTRNIARRFRQHVDGKAGVRYTRSHPPVRIAQCWRLFGSVGTALKIESLIKQKPRPVKDRLVANPSRGRCLPKTSRTAWTPLPARRRPICDRRVSQKFQLTMGRMGSSSLSVMTFSSPICIPFMKVALLNTPI